MRRYLLVLALAVVMVMASAGAALAGEVKGPPGSDPGTSYTQARTHANSECAYSGLNDVPDPDRVQSFGQNVKNGHDAKAFNPGDACGPGTNPHRGE